MAFATARHSLRARSSAGLSFRCWFSSDVKKDEREEGRRDRASCSRSARETGNAAQTRVWECQSQQRGAQWGAQGLLGRMHAKGIVGNYTGLEWASNTLIQQDSFIKKQGCWTGTQRAREINLSRPFFPSSPGLDLTQTFLFLCSAFAGWHLFERLSVHTEREEKKHEEVLLFFSNKRFLQRSMGVSSQALN